MFLQSLNIHKNSFVSDIIRQDYRTASVFRKYEIDFCCGGKWTFGMACDIKKLEFETIKTELEAAMRTIQLSNSLRFDEWRIDFLTEYIVNVHHQSLRDSMPRIKEHLTHFVEGHIKKFPFFNDVLKQFNYLYKDILPHLQQEEEILFPYVRHIAHAYESKESYASLLVRTLRKPVEEVMNHEHEAVSRVLYRLRDLTDNYTAPDNACVSHWVAYSMLKELDNDLTQHIYLENVILFPRVTAMEKQLLTNRAIQ